MSTAVWPPIPPDQLLKEEEAALARELEWLLSSLQETLQALKAGLEECAAVLAPTETGSTLVLSSHRSEHLKGFVTRVGTRIVKGDVKLRLSSLPPPRGATNYALAISSAPTAPTLFLPQLTSIRTLINACLDVVDVSTWTGDAHNANFISGQLLLLSENLAEAKACLRGGPDVQKPWFEEPLDDKVFDPPRPANLSLHFLIAEASLVLEVRTLEPVLPNQSDFHSGFSLRDRLAVALGGTRTPTHDEANETFTYNGQEVRVKEKVRVESADPSLMAALAKLSALEHTLGLSRRALDVLMGKSDEG